MINQKSSGSRKKQEKTSALKARALPCKSHLTYEAKGLKKPSKDTQSIKVKTKSKGQTLSIDKKLESKRSLRSTSPSLTRLPDEPRINNHLNDCDQEFKQPSKCTSRIVSRTKDDSNLKLNLNNDADNGRKFIRKRRESKKGKVYFDLDISNSKSVVKGSKKRTLKSNVNNNCSKGRKKVKSVSELLDQSNLTKLNKTNSSKSSQESREVNKLKDNVANKLESNNSNKSAINYNTNVTTSTSASASLASPSLSSVSSLSSSLTSKLAASQSCSKKSGTLKKQKVSELIKKRSKVSRKKANPSANKRVKLNQINGKKRSKQYSSKSKNNSKTSKKGIKKVTPKCKSEKVQTKRRDHRIASLNAICKVHLLFESEKEKPTEVESTPLATTGPARCDERKEKGKKASPSSLPSTSASTSRTSKKNNELVPYTNCRPIAKKRKSTHDEVEIIDTRSCKRMASLNASAILAASYLPEKIVKKSRPSFHSSPSPLTDCVEMIQETKISSSISRVEVTPNSTLHTCNGNSLVVESKKMETIEMIKQVRRVSGKIRDRLLAIEMMERENNKTASRSRLNNNGQKLIKSRLDKSLDERKQKGRRGLGDGSLGEGQARTDIRTEYQVTKVQINTSKGSIDRDKKRSHKIETILEKDAIVRKYQFQTKATSQSYRVEMETSTYNPIMTNVISSSNLHSVPCIPLHSSSVNELHLGSGSNVLTNPSLLVNQGLNHSSCFSYPNQSVLQLPCNTPYRALSPSSATLNQLPVLNIGPHYAPHYTSAFSVPHYSNHNAASIPYSPDAYGFYQPTAPIIQPVHDPYLRAYSVHKPIPFHATPLTPHHSEQGFKSNGCEQVLPHNNQTHLAPHFQTTNGKSIAQNSNSYILQCPSNELSCQPSSNNLYQLVQPSQPIMISSEIPVNIALNSQALLIHKNPNPNRSASASLSMPMSVNVSSSVSVPLPTSLHSSASNLNSETVITPVPSTSFSTSASTSTCASSSFVPEASTASTPTATATATATSTASNPNSASQTSPLPVSLSPSSSTTNLTTSNFFSNPFSAIFAGSNFDPVSNTTIGIGSRPVLMSHSNSSPLHTQIISPNTLAEYNVNNALVCDNSQNRVSKSVQCTPFNSATVHENASTANSFQSESMFSSLNDNMNSNLDNLKKFSKKDAATKKSSLLRLKVSSMSNILNKNMSNSNCLLNKKKSPSLSKSNQTLASTDNLENNNSGGLNKKTGKKRYSHSWSWKGSPVKKLVYVKADDPPQLRNSYSVMCHSQGDIIRVGDCVLLRSGPRKNDLHFVAKVCALWEVPETGEMMMTLLWYYRPEHTEAGRKPSNMPDEIFASKHRDVNNVACIDDKCYVLTYNEYCRHRKIQKMIFEKVKKSLTDVIVPKPMEEYFRKNRLPPGQVCPDRVLVCRKVYDFRLKRTLKNPA